MNGALLIIAFSLLALRSPANLATFAEVSARTSADQPASEDSPYGTPQKLSDVTKIYVDSLGRSDVSEEIRQKLLNRLIKAGFSVMDRPDEADAILTGIANVKVTSNVNGYMNVKNGNGYGTVNGGTDYTPSFAVRLVGRQGRILWSDESRFRLIHSPSATSNAADQIVKDLLKARAKKIGRG